MYRDMGYYWLRLAIYIALGFGLGTVFYRIGNSYSSINVRVVSVQNYSKLFRENPANMYVYIYMQARGSMLMFVSSLLTIMSIGGFPSFIEEMKVL